MIASTIMIPLEKLQELLAFLPKKHSLPVESAELAEQTVLRGQGILNDTAHCVSKRVSLRAAVRTINLS
jgi:hypothetical protein